MEPIRTRLRTVQNPLTKVNQTFHVVLHVHPKLGIKEAASLLFGDIILSVGGRSCSEFSEEEFAVHIDSLKAFVLEVVEMSVLRRNDLMEVEDEFGDEVPIVLPTEPPKLEP